MGLGCLCILHSSTSLPLLAGALTSWNADSVWHLVGMSDV